MDTKLIHGEALEELKKMPEHYVDAVIIDPPFGIGFNYKDKEKNTNPDDYWSWLKPIYDECYRVLKDGGFIAIWQTQLYFKFFWSWFGDDIQIYAGCKNFVQLRKTAINHAYDPIIMKYKPAKELLRPEKPKRNVDFFVANTAKWVTQTGDIVRKHPCPRPIDQTEQIVENFTIPNGIILDCFMGSGTTGVACVHLNRNFIGIEIEKDYFLIAEERIKRAENPTQATAKLSSFNSSFTETLRGFPNGLSPTS